MWWEHVADWTADQRVWEWVRTVTAALFGALVGGWFTLRGQTRAATAQAARDKIARENALEDERRKDGKQDARALHRSFIDLQRAIAEAPATLEQLFQEEPWGSEWSKVWTLERQRTLRVQAGLIPERATRDASVEVIDFLGKSARIFSKESTLPTATNMGLRVLVGALAVEGIALVEAYLRQDPYEARRPDLLPKLREAQQAYLRWGENNRKAEAQRTSAAQSQASRPAPQ